jgi:hypothetical protein
MDKNEMIESLQKIIEYLKGDDKPKPRYELRYWNRRGRDGWKERNSEPDSVHDDLELAKANAIERMEYWRNVELYDSKQDELIISYTESKE